MWLILGQTSGKLYGYLEFDSVEAAAAAQQVGQGGRGVASSVWLLSFSAYAENSSHTAAMLFCVTLFRCNLRQALKMLRLLLLLVFHLQSASEGWCAAPAQPPLAGSFLLTCFPLGCYSGLLQIVD